MRKLIIFAKCPRAGEVKTRLTPFLTKEEACEVYRKLAGYTFQLADEFSKEEGVAVEIAFSNGDLSEIQDFAPYPFTFQEQKGKDLGERLQHSLQLSLASGASQVVIIGTDCPEIQKSHLKSAFNQLLEADVTIGPSFDGGYYLIGFRGSSTSLLQNISWSTDKVFHQTIQTCEREQISRSLLPILHDLDNQQDYENLLPSYPWLKL